MRKVILYNSIGADFDTDFIGKINPTNKSFIKHFFKKSGKLKCGNLLETLKIVYEDNGDILDLLDEIDDKFNIHIMYNDIENPEIGNYWDVNLFLSKLFSTDVYADNPVIIVAEDEMNNDYVENTERDYNLFAETFNLIYDAVTTEFQDVENYLTRMCMIIDNDTTKFIEDVNEFQDEYIGTKKNNNFVAIENCNNGMTLLKRPGVMVLNDPTNNSGMYFFSQYYSKIINDSEYKEILS